MLLAGGVGYIVNTLVAHLAPDAAPATEFLTYLATVGEFWMIGWLLWYAFRSRRATRNATGDAAPAPVSVRP